MRIISFVLLTIVFSLSISSFANDERAGLAITEWLKPDNSMNSISEIQSSIKAIQQLYESGKINFSDDESKGVFERNFLNLNYSLLPLLVKQYRNLDVQAHSCYGLEDCNDLQYISIW